MHVREHGCGKFNLAAGNFVQPAGKSFRLCVVFFLRALLHLACRREDDVQEGFALAAQGKRACIEFFYVAVERAEQRRHLYGDERPRLKGRVNVSVYLAVHFVQPGHKVIGKDFTVAVPVVYQRERPAELAVFPFAAEDGDGGYQVFAVHDVPDKTVAVVLRSLVRGDVGGRKGVHVAAFRRKEAAGCQVGAEDIRDGGTAAVPRYHKKRVFCIDAAAFDVAGKLQVHLVRCLAEAFMQHRCLAGVVAQVQV